MKVEDFMLRRLLFASLAGLALVVASPSVPVRALTIGIDIDACDITTVPFESSLQLDLLGFPNSPDGSSIDNRYIFTQMEHVEATGDGSLEFVLDVTLDRELEGDVAEVAIGNDDQVRPALEVLFNGFEQRPVERPCGLDIVGTDMA